MRTRRSPRNQERLWNLLGREGKGKSTMDALTALKRLVRASTEALDELESMHSTYLKGCEGGCPYDAIHANLKREVELAHAIVEQKGGWLTP